MVDASLGGRSFKTVMGDSLFREQYLDAVARRDHHRFAFSQ
jgi:hypothetical protein